MLIQYETCKTLLSCSGLKYKPLNLALIAIGQGKLLMRGPHKQLWSSTWVLHPFNLHGTSMSKSMSNCDKYSIWQYLYVITWKMTQKDFIFLNQIVSEDQQKPTNSEGALFLQLQFLWTVKWYTTGSTYISIGDFFTQVDYWWKGNSFSQLNNYKCVIAYH